MNGQLIPTHVRVWTRAKLERDDAAAACARALRNGHTAEAEHQANRFHDLEAHMIQLEAANHAKEHAA